MSRRKKPAGKYRFKFPRTSHEWCQEYLRKLDEQPKNELYNARQAEAHKNSPQRPGNLLPGDLRSLSKSTAGTYASHIYRQNGVKSRMELLEKQKRIANEAEAIAENVSIAGV